MPPAQGSSASPSRAPRRAARPSFLAAVRYHDGRRERIAVRNALDAEDARREILHQIDGVAAVLVATLRAPAPRRA